MNTRPAQADRMILNHSVSRRKFLVATGAAAGATLAGALTDASGPAGGYLASAKSRVVARRNGTVAQMVQESVSAFGGIQAFVSPGDRVAIKVNGSWAIASANTSTDVVREVVSLVKSASPSQVVVYDHVIDGISGWAPIQSAAEGAGATAVMLGGDSSDYTQESLSGVSLKTTEIANVLRQSDVLINVPKLKTHSGSNVTFCLKNHLGSILNRHAVHQAELHQGIADLNTAPSIRIKHRLCIADAIEPMVTGGPKYGTYANYNGILAGVDPVAVDYVGTQIIRRYNPSVPQTPAYIQKAADLGLGIADPARIVFEEADVGTPVPEMGPGLLLAGLIGLGLLRGRQTKAASRGTDRGIG